MLLPCANIFIDGGGHNRILLEKYLNKFITFNKTYVFEPNPLFHDSYNGSKLVLVKKAIWTSNCRLPFYLSKDDRQVGSSLIKEKLCRVNTNFKQDFKDLPIEVECIDFSNWIKTNIKKTYNVTLKLDIEGAEYAVLWKMIKDNTISMIKELYVEFHKEHLKVTNDDHNKLINELKKYNLTLHDWD